MILHIVFNWCSRRSSYFDLSWPHSMPYIHRIVVIHPLVVWVCVLIVEIIRKSNFTAILCCIVFWPTHGHFEVISRSNWIFEVTLIIKCTIIRSFLMKKQEKTQILKSTLFTRFYLNIAISLYNFAWSVGISSVITLL